MARLLLPVAGGAGSVVVVAVATWLLAAGGVSVSAGDPPLSPKGLNYEGACVAMGGVCAES
jgi:hypothetical protein